MYIHVHTCTIYIYMHMYTHVHICMHTYIYIHVHVHVHNIHKHIPDKKTTNGNQKNAFRNCKTSLITLSNYKRSGSKLFIILTSTNAFAEAFSVLYCVKYGGIKEYLLLVILLVVVKQ